MRLNSMVPSNPWPIIAVANKLNRNNVKIRVTLIVLNLLSKNTQSPCPKKKNRLKIINTFTQHVNRING